MVENSSNIAPYKKTPASAGGRKLPTPKAGIMEIAPYVPGKSKAAQGVERVIKLSSNENALGCSEHAKAAYVEAAAQLHRYPDGQASLLKDAIHEVLGFKPSMLVCGAGSDEIIQFLIAAYAGVGDDVIQTEHGFLMYQIYAKSRGARPVFAKEKHLTTHVDALLAEVTERTKLVFVANPNNPTGTYIPLAELKRLRDGLPAHVLLVVDEAYVEYATAEDYESAASLVETTPNTVVLRTFSKAYGLPGLRLGYGYMPEAVADVLNRIRGPFNNSSAAIAAGAAAVRDEDFIRRSTAHNTEWRQWLTDEFFKYQYQIKPSQGNFILVQCGINANLQAFQLAAQFAERGIIVRELDNYGLSDYLRITIGTEEENQAVAKLLSQV